MQKSLTFTRLHVGHLDYTSDSWRDGTQTVLGMIADGRLKVPVEGCFSLDTVNEMFDALVSRQTAGKLIMQIGDAPQA